MEEVQAEKAERLLEEALDATRVDCPMTAGDVLLECGHDLHFHNSRPHKKEILWCRRCRQERRIAKLGTGKSYRVRCRTCSYTRGKDGEVGSDLAAVRHRDKKPQHTIDILNSTGTIVRTYEANPSVIYLPDEPPY